MADSQRKTGNLYNINAKDVNNGYVDAAQLNQDGTTETWGNAEISEYIPISGDTAYTFNGIGSYNSPCYALYDENKQLIGAYKYNGRSTINFTSPNNARYFRFTHIKIFAKAMMVEGTYSSSTMPEFEPYWQRSLRKLTTATDTITTLPAVIYGDGTNATVGLKGNTVQSGTPSPQNPIDVVGVGDLETSGEHTGQYKIPISSAGQTNNIYLGEVETTRKIRKLVFNGTEEGWEKSATSTRAGCFVLKGLGTGVTKKTMYCTHATNVSTASQLTSNNTCYLGNDFNIWLDLFNAKTTIEQFKDYLAAQYAAGTPVTVWYVLATEETAVVNEPLMRIGYYADTLSNISIPVTAGANTLSVDTTVQPSEVTVNYKGWHTGAVHERESGQWD